MVKIQKCANQTAVISVADEIRIQDNVLSVVSYTAYCGSFRIQGHLNILLQTENILVLYSMFQALTQALLYGSKAVQSTIVRKPQFTLSQLNTVPLRQSKEIITCDQPISIRHFKCLTLILIQLRSRDQEHSHTTTSFIQVYTPLFKIPRRYTAHCLHNVYLNLHRKKYITAEYVTN